MDSKRYLQFYGWKEGEALKTGGLRKPILVKHKRDKKGLGCAPGQDDGDAWWERLFDGHLKGLEISSETNEVGISFKQKKIVASGLSKESSPLYRRFVRGDSLRGTMDDLKEDKSNQSVLVFETKKRQREDRDDRRMQKKQRKQEKSKMKEKMTKKKKKSNHKKDETHGKHKNNEKHGNSKHAKHKKRNKEVKVSKD